MAPQTLLDKIWKRHVVVAPPAPIPEPPGGADHREAAGLALRGSSRARAAKPPAKAGCACSPVLLYIDLHLIHEVTSPQAFSGLRAAGRRLRRPDKTFATMDHDIPTDGGRGPQAALLPVLDGEAEAQLRALADNCRDFSVKLFDLASPEQGIVHVMAPELGLTQPGQIIVCGDSHTATHGAFGALAFGIGTSEVEHVFATQCLWQPRPRNLRLRIEGQLAPGATAKDLILYVIGEIGADGAGGYVIEYAGQAIRSLTMEERMTVCNMSIEAGARAGMIAPDATTVAYLRGRPYAPQGAAFEHAAAQWLQLASDDGAVFDRELSFRAAEVAPQVTWGTSPAMVAPITGAVPDPAACSDPARRQALTRALAYMDLRPGTPLRQIAVDRVFIGSCTNARIEDLERAAAIVRGRRVASGVRAMVVPGSAAVRREAEQRGLDRIFAEAGFEWRQPGCSMCLGMNPDILQPGERCASTSNRNFEGRQGAGGRTHLVSPEMAAAAACAGHFIDVREWARRGDGRADSTEARSRPSNRVPYQVSFRRRGEMLACLPTPPIPERPGGADQREAAGAKPPAKTGRAC